MSQPDPPSSGPHRSRFSLREFLLGPPIATSQQDEARLPKLLALPIFSSDAISSVAYATQEILLALAGAGLAAAALHAAYARAAWEVAGAIVLLLAVVAASYRQTIFAYPSGGGSYIVSRENLGEMPGLVAAAALLIDYVLTVAVSIASGVQNLVSTPALHPLAHHVVLVCLGCVALLTLANLRGLKQAGALFALPTYAFIGLAYVMIGLGIAGPLLGWRLHPEAVNQTLPPAYVLHAAGTVGLVVLLRAFANGCSAMTGTEAISNGVPAFRKSESGNAATTLLWMAGILASLFVGITWLATRFHVVYWEQDGRTAPAVIDQLSSAVFGRSGGGAVLYYLMQGATAAILVLAANTSFADFPRLASILARDRFLPRQLQNRGERLVFSSGIVLLGLAAGVLLVLFRGSVDRLIPLYALGVFTAFTLSQSGMVRHWWRERGRHWQLKAAINGLGAVATGVVFTVIVVEKAPQGAWIVVVLAGVLIALFRTIHRRYGLIHATLQLHQPPVLTPPRNEVVVLVSGPHAGIVPALRYARLLSPSFRALYLEIDPERTADVRKGWQESFPGVPLCVLPSPYRSIVGPVLDYVDEIRRSGQADLVTVVLPEYFTDAWWDLLLHDAAGPRLKLALLGRDDVVLANVRFHVPETGPDPQRPSGPSNPRPGGDERGEHGPPAGRGPKEPLPPTRTW